MNTLKDTEANDLVLTNDLVLSFFSSSPSIWLMRIDGKTGHITLNPDVPQDVIVLNFIELCNKTISEAKNHMERIQST